MGALGMWLVVGVFIDGWAHVNQASLETFFTPWHAILYSGAFALFGYVARLRHQYGQTPVGYELAVWGGPVFLLGGLADFGWHQAIGIEVGLDALLSPTHLILLISGVMVLATPWRAALRRSPRTTLVAVLSLAMTTSLVSFFLIYVSAFAEPYAAQAVVHIPEGAPGHQAAEMPAALGLGSYLVTTILLLVPVILLLRREQLPFGSFTLLLGLVAGLTTIVVDARQPLVPVAGVLAGLMMDGLSRVPTDRPERWRTPALAAALATSLWTLQLLGLAITDGVAWPPALWSGVVLLTTGSAAVLAHLAAPGTVDRKTPQAVQPELPRVLA